MAWNDWGHFATGGLTTQKGRNWLFGTDNEMQKLPTGTPEQQQLGQNLTQNATQFGQPGGGFGLANNWFNQLLGGGQGGQEGAYNQFAQPYMQQFESQILPMIAEKYGGMGALSSSGFGQALGGAGAGLQSQLAQLFSSLQGQAAQSQYGQYNQMNQTALGYSPFAYNENQGSQGMLAPFLTAGAKGFGG